MLMTRDEWEDAVKRWNPNCHDWAWLKTPKGDEAYNDYLLSVESKPMTEPEWENWIQQSYDKLPKWWNNALARRNAYEQYLANFGKS